jgi:hypothetical protein
MTQTVHLDMSKWRRYHDHLLMHGFPKAASDKIVARYSAEMRRRFNGSDWVALSPQTIRKRRKRSNKPLLDTGLLRQALAVGSPGNFYKHDRRGIEFGFANSGRSKDGKRTIGQIARYHQMGMGNNPVRRILVEPKAMTLKRMAGDVAVELEKLGVRLVGR